MIPPLWYQNRTLKSTPKVYSSPINLLFLLSSSQCYQGPSSCPGQKLTIIAISLFTLYHITTVQFSSVAQSCPTLCDPMGWNTPGLPVHHQLLEFTQTHVHWVSDAIQPCHPLSSPSLPAPSLSQHFRVFSSGSVLCVRWPKCWSFSFSISPSNEYSGLISFRMDWLALLAVQGNLKSLLQHYSSKASILQCSARKLSYKEI